jgi:hypothetical protein
MDTPLDKLSIEFKIIEFGVRSKKLWTFQSDATGISEAVGNFRPPAEMSGPDDGNFRCGRKFPMWGKISDQGGYF